MRTTGQGVSGAALVIGAGLLGLIAASTVDVQPGGWVPEWQAIGVTPAFAAGPGKGTHGKGGKHIGGRKHAGKNKGGGSQHEADSGHGAGAGGKAHVPDAAESDHADHAGASHDGGSQGGKKGAGHVAGESGHGQSGWSAGGQSGGQPAGGRGGAPVWAKGGIPEVELGRLNVARAPAQVLDRALNEALENWDGAMAALYESTAEAAAAKLATAYAMTPRFDSPLQNLGLYKDLLANGQTRMPGVTPASKLDLAAILLGSASDKSMPLSTDSVTALNTIFGLTLGEGEAAILAGKADAVRAGILTGHGN